MKAYKHIEDTYNENFIQFYKKYFSDKNINESIFNMIKNISIELASIYIRYCMLCDSIKKFQQKEINKNKIDLKDINKKLYMSVYIRKKLEYLLNFVADEITK